MDNMFRQAVVVSIPREMKSGCSIFNHAVQKGLPEASIVFFKSSRRGFLRDSDVSETDVFAEQLIVKGSTAIDTRHPFKNIFK